MSSTAGTGPGITIGRDFQICEADYKLGPKERPEATTPTPSLGALKYFSGDFCGKGFNLIFRPNSGPKGTTFPNPVTPAPPTPPNEQLLEINLTEESLSFSEQLGSIPNRGLEGQDDIFLNGKQYLQTVNDVTNIDTGLADGKPSGIHVEVGQWMHIPATTNPPLGITLCRMGCIPHGTTINAQCLEPTAFNPGPPKIGSVDITPFPINNEAKKIPFAAQTASNTDTPRLPQDLTKFMERKTITQEMLTDPNTVLRKANEGKKIVEHITFTVSTSPSNPELGGGTANIAFLVGAPAPPPTGSQAPAAPAAPQTGPQVPAAPAPPKAGPQAPVAPAAPKTGSQAPIAPAAPKTGPQAPAAPAAPKGPQTGPNALAAQMTATFWIEIVEHEIEVHPHRHGPQLIEPEPPFPGAIMPVYEVHVPHYIRESRKITVRSTQLQYSQMVNLNFAGLTWPHCSVATLVPAKPVRVPESAFSE